MIGMACDGQFDAAAFLGQQSFDERDIGFLNGAMTKTIGEFGVREVIFCDKKHSRRFLVETMDDAGT